MVKPPLVTTTSRRYDSGGTSGKEKLRFPQLIQRWKSDGKHGGSSDALGPKCPEGRTRPYGHVFNIRKLTATSRKDGVTEDNAFRMRYLRIPPRRFLRHISLETILR